MAAPASPNRCMLSLGNTFWDAMHGELIVRLTRMPLLSILCLFLSQAAGSKAGD